MTTTNTLKGKEEMTELVKQVKWLRSVPDGTWQGKQEMSNNIKDLKQCAYGLAETVSAMSNKIKWLEEYLVNVEEYSDKQAAVIESYVNQITDLKNER
tara:strand:- start:1716 stop:2009 length:294 start_codon:yes stop_codon:yes gene_type:complete